MDPSSRFGADGDTSLQVLWEDDERVFCRGESHAGGYRVAVLVVLPVAAHPTPAILDRLAREYGLKDVLDEAWAVRPLELVRERGLIMLVLEDTSSEPLDRLVAMPMDVGSFLRLAIAIAAALTQVHRRRTERMGPFAELRRQARGRNRAGGLLPLHRLAINRLNPQFAIVKLS